MPPPPATATGPTVDAGASGQAWTWRTHVLLGAVVLGFAAALWAHTVGYFFVLEDSYFLVDAVTAQQDWRTLLDVTWLINGVHVRPVLALLFRLEYALFGFRPILYHLVHLAGWGLCTLALGAWLRDRGAPAPVLWLALAAFAWHPAHWPWLGLAVQGTFYVGLLGMLVVLWAGQRVLEGGTRRDAAVAVCAFALGIWSSEYPFLTAAAVGAVAVLHRNRQALRLLLPLWILMGAYVALRVALLRMPTLDGTVTWSVYTSDLQRYGSYLPKVVGYVALALPGLHAWIVGHGWVVGVGPDASEQAVLYGAVTVVVAAALVLARRRTAAPRGMPAHLFDLAGLQTLGCLALLCVAPGVHPGRLLYPALGLILLLVWAMAPQVRRPVILGACLLGLAVDAAATVHGARRGGMSGLSLQAQQAQNRVHTNAYRALFRNHPDVDAVFVHGLHARPIDYRRLLLQAATPPTVQWIDAPARAEPFTTAVVWAMTGPHAFEPVGRVHSPDALRYFVEHTPLTHDADEW